MKSTITRLLFKIKNKSFKAGKKFKSGYLCSISRKNSVVLGNNFYMGNFCSLSSNLIVGDDVMLGSSVMFVGGDHKIDFIKVPLYLSGRDELKTTVIEDNVWIGSGAIILHGVKIESGSVIAAGSVLTKSTGKDEIWAGNPARFIRKRL